MPIIHPVSEVLIDWAIFRVEQIKYWHTVFHGRRGKHLNHIDKLETQIKNITKPLAEDFDLTPSRAIILISNLIEAEWRPGFEKNAQNNPYTMIKFLNTKKDDHDYLRRLGIMLQEIAEFKKGLEMPDHIGFILPTEPVILDPARVAPPIKYATKESFDWLVNWIGNMEQRYVFNPHYSVNTSISKDFFPKPDEHRQNTKAVIQKLIYTAHTVENFVKRDLYRYTQAFLELAKEMKNYLLLNETPDPFYNDMRMILADIAKNRYPTGEDPELDALSEKIKPQR